MDRILICGAISLLFGGCSSYLPARPLLPVTPQVIETVFGGAANHEIVKTAASVEACRMKVKTETLQSAEHEYDLGPFVTLTDAQAGHLRRILDSPNSYGFGVAKGCIPVYGVRIRFETPEGMVDVDLCFQCDILLVSRDGKPVAGEDFDAVRPALVALCKELFPDDAEIQRLDPND